MEDERIEIGVCKTVEEAFALLEQHLLLTKSYDKEEYEDLIENGVICIEVRPTEISPQ